MTAPKYTDPWDDPTVDPEDVLYGDYDDELPEGFHVYSFDTPEEEDLDDD